MVHLLQHSAGQGCRSRRNMLGALLWVVFFGLSGEAFSAIIYKPNESPDVSQSTVQNSTKVIFPSANTKEDKKSAESSLRKEINSASLLLRSTREVPQTKNSIQFLANNVLESDRSSDSVQKSPAKSKTLFVIPYLRPGRSDNGKEKSRKLDTMIPMARFGRQDSDLITTDVEYDDHNSASKKHDTVIPMVRYGKSDSRSSSMIPNPRFGRSISFMNENDITSNSDETSDNDYIKISYEEGKGKENHINDDTLDSEKREDRDLEDYETVIPYPRPGRNSLQQMYNLNMLEKENKRLDSDYVLPQIRYGRSMFLLSSPKSDEGTKPNPHTFVLPYPRPGRSSKFPKNVGHSENLQVILPYPRPGRSIFDENVELWNKRQGGYMLPHARLGRTASDFLFRLESEDSMNNDKTLGNLIIHPLFLKLEQKNLSDKHKDLFDRNFMIPYPRPGKKATLKMNTSQGKQRSNNRGKESSDYILPYPRPGRTSSKALSSKNSKTSNNDNESTQKFILPYPRPGRSETTWFDGNEEVESYENEEKIDYSTFAKQTVDADEINNDDGINLKAEDLIHNVRKNSEKTENGFMMPYARLGRNLSTVVPIPRPGSSYNQDKNSHVSAYKDGTNSDVSIPYYESLIPERGFDDLYTENASHLRYKRSNTVVPYPRLGRSEMIIPYPRLGRSESVVHPRTGRPNSVILNPRLGRSNSVIPYPRLGRSDSVVPYPRPGRSNFVVPYPRPGRSDSVVPYPRPGRSNSILPYPRLGRSDSVVPYPRPGRSNSVVPYPRLGRSDSVIPYPRPGRSSSVVPYPRLGRSDSVVPYPRPGRSNSVVPYPRLGRSDSVVPYPRPGRSNFVVPYPRLGRSDYVVPYPRTGRSNSVVPYPRLGRSDSVVPYPRPGRSNSVVPYPRPGRSDTVVPYPRPGRSDTVLSKRREKRSLSEFSYRTQGLSSTEDLTPSSGYEHKNENWILSNLRSRRSEDETYVIPYPRPGRSKNAMQFGDFGYSYGGKRLGEGSIIPYPRFGRSNTTSKNGEENRDRHTIIPYPRLGRSQEQVTLAPDFTNSVHKLNKHMLSSVDDSIYLLPYPRPGRYSD